MYNPLFTNPVTKLILNYCVGISYMANVFVVDGGWSDWNTGKCSVPCGGGIKEKFRLCNNPTPSCGGKECSGKKWRVWSAMSFLVMLKVRKLIITGFFTDRAQNKYLYEVGWPLLALLQIVSDSPLKMYSKFVLS